MDESQRQNKKWHSALTYVVVRRGECHFSEEIFLGVSEPDSSKPETRKIRSPIKGGKAFGRRRRGRAPNRCREQTGRLQLDVDEVAHKMLIEDQFGARVWFELGRGGKLISDWNLRANFYPEGYKTQKHTDQLQMPKYHIFT